MVSGLSFILSEKDPRILQIKLANIRNKFKVLLSGQNWLDFYKEDFGEQNNEMSFFVDHKGSEGTESFHEVVTLKLERGNFNHSEKESFREIMLKAIKDYYFDADVLVSPPILKLGFSFPSGISSDEVGTFCDFVIKEISS